VDNVFSIEMTELPTTGGSTGDPSILRSVNHFLSKESHLRKVNQLLQEDGCVVQYWSLIDCVLVELLPHFKESYFEFYEGKGKPLASLHSVETIEAIDVELMLNLEILVSKKWQSWTDFKRDFKSEIMWEPLWTRGLQVHHWSVQGHDLSHYHEPPASIRLVLPKKEESFVFDRFLDTGVRRIKHSESAAEDIRVLAKIRSSGCSANFRRNNRISTAPCSSAAWGGSNGFRNL